MQPEGTNSAASMPKISAARCSSRLTVGSSPYTSSPTSASAIARRISAVGRVTVSLRKSTTPSAGVTRSGSRITSIFISVATSTPLLCALRALRLCELCVKSSLPLRASAKSASLYPEHRRARYLLSSIALPHQLHEHLIRHANSPRRQPHHTSRPLNQPCRTQPRKSRIQRNSILPLNPRDIDSLQLPQPQKQFLFQRAFRRKRLVLLHGQAPRRHRIHVLRRIVRIRPAFRPGNRMRPRSKSQIPLPTSQ